MKYPRFRRTIPGETIRPEIVLEISEDEHVSVCAVTDEEQGDTVTEALNQLLDLKESTEKLLDELKTLHPHARIPAESKVQDTLKLIDVSLKRMQG